MKIIGSLFEELTTDGAVSLNKAQVIINIYDSVFIRCYNSISGGAININSENSNSEVKRLCGKLCHTLTSNYKKDYGQFMLIKCTKGMITQDSLSVSMCSDKAYTKYHHGPISNEGNAAHYHSHSNVSDCHCYYGCGFCGFDANSLWLSYMNFANDSTYISENLPGYWMASLFHRASGEVSFSNYIECKSAIKGTTEPLGTFINCSFVKCSDYPIELLFQSHKIDETLDISYPMKCVAILNKCSEKAHCKTALILLNTIHIF